MTEKSWDTVARVFFNAVFLIQGLILFSPATVGPYMFIAEVSIFISIVMVVICMWHLLAINEQRLKPCTESETGKEQSIMFFQKAKKHKYAIFSVLLVVPVSIEGYKYLTGGNPDKFAFYIALILLIYNVGQIFESKKQS